MRISDPRLVYFKLMTDASRLKDWADRRGNDSHKAFAKALEEVLRAKQNLFTADTTAAKPAPTTAPNPVKMPPHVLGQIARESNIDRDGNPYDESHPDFSLWDEGWCYRDDNPREIPNG